MGMFVRISLKNFPSLNLSPPQTGLDQVWEEGLIAQ